MPKINYNPLSGKFDLTENKAGKINITDAGDYYTGTEVETALQELKTSPDSAGVYVLPSILDNGDGTITLGSGEYVFASDPDGSTPYKKYTIAGDTYSFTDQVTNYILANLNGGSPTITVTTSTSTIENQTVIPVLTVFRAGTYLYYIKWNLPGKGLANKLMRRFVRTHRFDVEPGGLILGEVATNNITLTAGKVWNGAQQTNVSEFSSVTDSMSLYAHVSGVWTKSTITSYNNTQYDDGTNLQTLPGGAYAVNWVFRSLNENQNEVLIVLGNGAYTVAQAQVSTIPSLPPEITSLSVLVGRIIVKSGDSTATYIQSAFTQTFSGSLVNDHAQLSNLQGGTAGEYYHLTNAEAVVLSNTSGTNTGDQTNITGNAGTVTNGVYTTDSIDVLADVDITTDPVAKNDVLMFNGTNFVPVVEGTTFTFSCTAFDDSLTTGILAGAGVWKSSSTISFTATYDNGPPTTADVKMSINGGAYNDVGNMDGPTYTTGSNYDGAINYPTVDQYLRFRLDSSDGVDPDIDYAASLYFYNYIYYGNSTTGSGFNEANVEALTGTISSSYTTSRSINAGASNYVVWAYPSRYTSIHASGARFNSVTMPFTAPETVSITNTAGLTENYKVFASTQTNLGNSTLTLSTSANLINPFYYGGSTLNTGWSAAQIKALTDVQSPITNNTTQTFNSVTLASSEYFVFAYPSRLSDPSNWFDNGTGFPLSLNAGSPETVSITNVNGYTENYDVWVSNNILGPGAFQLRTT